MYFVVRSKSYRKAFKRLSKSPGFDVNKLEEIVVLLASGKQLSKEYFDHPLKGDMGQFRECHIKNDFLLVYKIEKKELVLTLIDLGTHASIF